MRFMTKALTGFASLYGVYDTKRKAYEVNPKTNKNFTFSSTGKADVVTKMFNDAATKESTEKTAARVAKAKATRAKNKALGTDNRPTA